MPTGGAEEDQAGPGADRKAKSKAGAAKALELFGRAQKEGSGLVAGAIVLVLALLLTAPLYSVWGFPGRLIESLVARNVSGACAATASGFTGFFCEAKLAFFALFGALVVALTLFFLRRTIRKGLLRAFVHLPKEVAFLPAPLVAGLAFTLSWAAVEFHFFDRPGIVLDGLFPTVVAVLTYITVRYSPDLQEAGSRLLAMRDRIPRIWRIILLFAIPVVLGLALPIRTPVRDQLVVVVGILAGWILLLPTKGDPVGGLADAATGGLRPDRRVVTTSIVLLALLAVPAVQAYSHCAADGWFTQDPSACEAAHHNGVFSAGTGVAGMLIWLVAVSLFPSPTTSQVPPPAEAVAGGAPSPPPSEEATPQEVVEEQPDPDKGEEAPGSEEPEDGEAEDGPEEGQGSETEPESEEEGDAGATEESSEGPPEETPGSETESEESGGEEEATVDGEERDPEEGPTPSEEEAPQESEAEPSGPEEAVDAPTPSEEGPAPGTEGDLGADIYEGIDQGLDDAQEGISTASDLLETLGDFTSGMKDDIDKVVEGVGDGMDKVRDVLGEDLPEAAQDAADKFREGMETAAGVADKVGGWIESAGEWLGSAAGVVDKVDEYWDEANEAADKIDGYNGLNDNQRDMLLWVRMTTKGAGDAIGKFMDGLLAPVKAVFGDDAGDAVKDVVPVGEFVEEGGKAVVNAAKNFGPASRYGDNLDQDMMDFIGYEPPQWGWGR